MPQNILIDINIVLDVLIKRRGYKVSSKVIELNKNNDYRLYVSAHTLTTLAYLLERDRQPQTIITKSLNWVLQSFKIVSVNNEVLEAALRSPVEDYEDAVMEQAAVACSAVAIITRNTKDFKLSTVPAMTPEAFLQ